MIPLARFKELTYKVLHLGDSPQRTALAFAVGTFIAFSPTYGLHTVSALFCAWAFRLNLVALMAGNFLNNPWTFLPIIGSSMWVGLLLVPVGATPEINWNDFTVRMLWHELYPYLVPFVLGHTILGILAALLCYALAYIGIRRFREHQAQAKHLATPHTS